MEQLTELPYWLGLLQRPLLQLGGSSLSIARIAGLIAIVVGVWWGAVLVEQALRRSAAASDITRRATVFGLARIARYAIWTIGTFVGLGYLGFDLTTFALLSGAIGVGIGFGLQTIFSNLISGVILLLEKTLKHGDFVDLASGVRGTVTEIGMRYTRITTNAEVDVIVPNSEFINARVTNWTLDNRFRRINVPFSVAYGSDKERVRTAALEAARAVPFTIENDQRRSAVWFTAFGDSSLNFELVVWIGPDAVARPGHVLSAYLWALDDALARHGLEIPFPQRDLHVRSGRLDVAVEPSSS